MGDLQGLAMDDGGADEGTGVDCGDNSSRAEEIKK